MGAEFKSAESKDKQIFNGPNHEKLEIEKTVSGPSAKLDFNNQQLPGKTQMGMGGSASAGDVNLKMTEKQTNGAEAVAEIGFGVGAGAGMQYKSNPNGSQLSVETPIGSGSLQTGKTSGVAAEVEGFKGSYQSTPATTDAHSSPVSHSTQVASTSAPVEGNGGGTGWNSSLVPDKWGKADLTPACNTHDACYSKPGAIKEQCDAQFHQDLLKAGAPEGVAAVYYTAVDKFGQKPFNEAQNETWFAQQQKEKEHWQQHEQVHLQLTCRFIDTSAESSPVRFPFR